MATDLNLQRQSTVSLPENVSAEARVRFNQEVLNRERVWMHCYVTDRRWVFSTFDTAMYLTLLDAVSRRRWASRACSLART